MNLSTKPAIPSRILARKVGEETVILDLESGNYFSVDAVGARIWELLGDGRTLAEVCDALLDEHDVAREQVEEDVRKLADDLLQHRLIEIP